MIPLHVIETHIVNKINMKILNNFSLTCKLGNICTKSRRDKKRKSYYSNIYRKIFLPENFGININFYHIYESLNNLQIKLTKAFIKDDQKIITEIRNRINENLIEMISQKFIYTYKIFKCDNGMLDNFLKFYVDLISYLINYKDSYDNITIPNDNYEYFTKKEKDVFNVYLIIMKKMIEARKLFPNDHEKSVKYVEDYIEEYKNKCLEFYLNEIK
jgi:hypothetical protein